MKKRIIGLLVVSFALLQLFSLSAMAQDSEAIALALVVKGNAEIKHGIQEWKTLEFGEVLVDSDQVRTGDDGFIALAFTDDGSQIKIRPNSMATLKGSRLEDMTLSKQVVMGIGELLADVKKQKGAVQVSTPTSVASVKGTSFWVILNENGETTVVTLEGLVELANNVSGTSRLVSAGRFGVSGPDGSLDVATTGPDTYVPGWDEEPDEPDTEPQGDSTPSDTTSTEEPEVEPEPDSAPPQAPAGRDEGSGGGGLGLNMNGAVGATVIDGETYQYFSFRPDIQFGKFGIGLDLSFYFDAEGNMLEGGWDEGADVIDKIYYVRYGQLRDPLYVRVGALDNVTFGYGLIMNRYSNAIEWPQVRRVGLHTQINKGPFGVEAIVNNFREISDPGLVGTRFTYEWKVGLPVVFGATYMMDGNQFLGAPDDDDDGIPDPFDQFPGKHDGDEIIGLNSNLDPADITFLIENGHLPDINNPPPSIDDEKDDIGIWGVDIGIPIIRKEHMNLWIYGQMAQIMDYGSGITAPGLSFNLGPFRAGAEYRIFEKQFMPEFFNLGYEIERVTLKEDSTIYYMTKEEILTHIPSSSGYFVDAGISISNLFDIYAAYQQLSYDDDDSGIEFPSKTFFARASVNTEPIPKLGLAQAYYHQPRADDIFDTETDGTTLGYKFGLEMSAGMMIVFDHKTIYRNGEPEKITTVETVMTF